MYMLVTTPDPSVVTLTEEARQELNARGFKVGKMPNPSECSRHHARKCLIATATGRFCYYGLEGAHTVSPSDPGSSASVHVSNTTLFEPGSYAAFGPDTAVARLSKLFDSGELTK